MRKSLFVLFYTLVVLHAATAQLPIAFDSIYQVIKSNSVFTASANWQTIDEMFESKLVAATNDIDSINALVEVFKQLDDVHSSITYNYKQYGHYHGMGDSLREIVLPVYEYGQSQINKLATAVLNGEYLYIRLPGYQVWGNDVHQFAQDIHDSICKYATYPIKGIVLDLRINTGGQISAMLGGLSLLLGEGKFGAAYTENGVIRYPFEIHENDFFMGDVRSADITSNCTTGYHELPIAVLIGPVTSSSGTITAIAFKNRPHTQFVGEATADGYSTGNDYYVFGENLTMNLATTLFWR
jgi:carboxyl-terminal processing protease